MRINIYRLVIIKEQVTRARVKECIETKEHNELLHKSGDVQFNESEGRNVDGESKGIKKDQRMSLILECVFFQVQSKGMYKRKKTISVRMVVSLLML